MFGSATDVGSGIVTDARGHLRPQNFVSQSPPSGGDNCDVGTFELDAVNLLLTVNDSADPILRGSGAANLVYSVALTNAGAEAATGIAVNVAVPAPTGVSEVVVTPSSGSWDGGSDSWTLASLAPGANAVLTVVLTVDVTTAPGTNVLTLTATATALDQSQGSGVLPTAQEQTSVVTAAIFSDGFESGGVVWSLFQPISP